MAHTTYPTPWCFLGTLPTCDGAGPMYSCPDSTVWPDPKIPCHTVTGHITTHTTSVSAGPGLHVSVSTPPVPYTGTADVIGSLSAGGILVLCGLLVFALICWATR